MIYDCFTYFDERDLLEIRLHELAPVVDRFVVVEATQTFTGVAKPLHFQACRARFKRFADRITHVVVSDGDAAGAIRGLPYYKANRTANPSFGAYLDKGSGTWARSPPAQRDPARARWVPAG